MTTEEGTVDGARRLAVFVRSNADGGRGDSATAVIRILDPLDVGSNEHLGLPESASSAEVVQRSRDFFLGQAREIHTALLAALPGGTYDALFALMAHHKASLLVVPAKGLSPERSAEDR